MRFVVFALLVSRTAGADLANNEAIHAHVDDVVAHLEHGASAKHDPSLWAERLALNLGVLVPVYGSIRLDRKVFGSIRPAAVVFDWTLGGLAPAALGITALADTSLSEMTRRDLAWAALALYLTTRVGVLIVGNMHISEYNHYMKLRLGIAQSPVASNLTLIVAGTSW